MSEDGAAQTAGGALSGLGGGGGKQSDAGEVARVDVEGEGVDGCSSIWAGKLVTGMFVVVLKRQKKLIRHRQK